ncbi:unnamed protein product [Onchocerca flexuosa]|uniref:DUF2156 domain-containing protein n=1 Tax=Onchocerca flexuosa TaxID=387005 RepID=A0A183I164_9BILA|nr:unnamed protein product [Onchocerca flexuosa]
MKSPIFLLAPIMKNEIIGAEKIRIDDIPDLFNTVFYLARCWRAYGGDLDRIKRYMKDLFDHRRMLACDCIGRQSQFSIKLSFLHLKDSVKSKGK